MSQVFKREIENFYGFYSHLSSKICTSIFLPSQGGWPMIILSANVESQTASNQQEMP